MKISIGFKQISGPYGGGNQFLINFQEYLKKNGHTVVNNLDDLDIDIILITNPLIDSETSTFDNFDVDKYLKFKNSNAIVFQRINECDERKGTKKINKKLNLLNRNVDINIYVSYWLKNIFSQYKMGEKESYVVMGGPSSLVFNSKNKKFWDKKQKIKLVTHHWSNNWSKGFDEYLYLDKLISTKSKRQDFEFTFIGNLPVNFKFQNTKVVNPLSGIELAEEIKKHHIYLTASKNEPSGNHHMEGAMCGLPILYVESGGLPEYCFQFGETFNKDTFLISLEKITENYDKYCSNLKSYPFTFENAAKQYLDIFEESLLQKEEILKIRNIQSDFIIKFRYYRNKINKITYKKLVNSKKTLGKLKNKLK